MYKLLSNEESERMLNMLDEDDMPNKESDEVYVEQEHEDEAANADDGLDIDNVSLDESIDSSKKSTNRKKKKSGKKNSPKKNKSGRRKKDDDSSYTESGSLSGCSDASHQDVGKKKKVVVPPDTYFKGFFAFALWGYIPPPQDMKSIKVGC